MRISLLTAGTRGDVQPFVAIGAALRERGHDVVLCASSDLVDFGARAGLDVVAYPIASHEVLNSAEGKRLLAGGIVLGFLRMVQRAVSGKEDAVNAAFDDATAGADVIAAAPLCVGPAEVLARARGVPLVPVYLQPLVPTSAFPSPLLTATSLGPLNALTHHLVEFVADRAGKEDAAVLAARVNTPPPSHNLVAAARRRPSLHTYSPVVVPRPADWPGDHVLTGMLSLSPSTRAQIGEQVAPAGLVEFLNRGPPPVFFGFGSMPVLDPQATLRLIAEVADDVGVRALVGAGWSDYGAADDGVFVVGAFDHDTFLPRCRVAVHHGGCGTTHSVLRAGLPAVVCSFLTDQPFWARQLRRLGVGVHLPYVDLRRDRLAAALRAILDDETKRRAQALSTTLLAEDGARVAAEFVEAAIVQGDSGGRQRP